MAAEAMPPNVRYGRLLESTHISGYAWDRACDELVYLLEDDRWREVGNGFDDINKFIATIDLSPFNLEAPRRRALVQRLDELDASQRATARALGVNHKTVQNDLALSAGDKSPVEPDQEAPDQPEHEQGGDKSPPLSQDASGLEPDEVQAIEDTLYDAFGDDVSDEDRERAVEENLESKQLPAISKPDLGDGVSHPARFSKALLPEFAKLLEPGWHVLDPFAGVGGIHDLCDLVDVSTVGVELEPEWALCWGGLVGTTGEWAVGDFQPPGKQTMLVGSALDLPFDDEQFDAVVTSPTYGNRLADHHNASDPESRRSYTHDLGRALADENTGDLHWGAEYRDMHERAWTESVRVLRPGGRFVLNIKDHIRGGNWQLVTTWHTAVLVDLGLHYDPELSLTVGTPSLRQGENATARVPWECVLVFDKGVS